MSCKWCMCVPVRAQLLMWTRVRSCHSVSGTVTQHNSIKHILNTTPIAHSITSVQGWVYRYRRLSNKLAFVRLTDGSSAEELQVVLNSAELVRGVRQGAAVSVTGQLVNSPAPKQPIELHATTVHVHALPDTQVTNVVGARSQLSPLQMRHQMAIRTKHASLQALLRVRQRVQMVMHSFLQTRDYLLVDTPMLSANDCEGAGELFAVTPANTSLMPDGEHYFGKAVFLSVSGQLHLEAITSGMSRVYSLGPAFRAERSVTRHHLAEFYMLEVETAFQTSLHALLDVCALVEQLVRSVLGVVHKECAQDLYVLHSAQLSLTTDKLHIEHEHTQTNNLECFLGESAYPRVTFAEALHILQATCNNFQFPVNSDSKNLKREHEKYLVEYFGNRPVFVTDFPSESKPFYMKQTDNEQTCLCFDLLAPVSGEICGGSLREDNVEVLQSRMTQRAIHNEHLDWYVGLRQAGYAPTAGFGIGLERLIQSALNVQNAKDTLPFPRWYAHCPM